MCSYKSENIKLLIVDDEPLIRQGIKSFINWEELNVEIIGDAENGSKALAIAQEAKPDFVITDIRMPEMDGLILIGLLKEIIPESVFVILSGYDDFDYARQAISLGVSSYILKPLRKNEFIQIINQCIQKCRKIQLVKAEEERLNAELEKLIPVLRDNYISNIIHGIVQPDTERLQELKINIENSFYIVSSIRFAGRKNKRKINRDLFILRDKLDQIIQYYCKKIQNNIKFYILIDHDVVKLLFSIDEKSRYIEILKSILCDLELRIKELYDEELICGVGSLSSDLIEISNSSAEADKVLGYRILECNKTALFIDDINENVQLITYLLSNPERKKLINAIYQGDLDIIHSIFERIKAKLSNTALIHPGHLYFVFLDIIVSVARYLSEDRFNIEKIYNMKIFSYDYVASFNNLDELISWVEEIIFNISKSFMEYKLRRPRRIIEEIKEYIIQNIHMDINLNFISQKFYYNPSYISRLFSEEINKNFSNFVTEQKIEFAARLLLETDLKVNEICEKVGYSENKYFTTIFKSLKGITPSEFRKKSCGNYEF